MNLKDLIFKNVLDAVNALYGDAVTLVLPKLDVTYPPNSDFGDYACNAPLIIGKELHKNPMQIATEIIAKLPKDNKIASVTAASPGFLNFKIAKGTTQAVVNQVIKDGSDYGTLTPEKPLKIQVEFVSANPTGPLHIGNFRGGPLGDSLASVLQKAGHQVEREYYHNDLGNQVKKLGESIVYRINEIQGKPTGEFPEGGYKGEYVTDLAKKVIENHTSPTPHTTPTTLTDPIELGKYAVDYFRDQALELCRTADIHFDNVTAESDAIDKGWTKKSLEQLQKGGYLKVADGATWFAPSDSFLEDRECVVIKSSGDYDYFSNDIGYHQNKFERGFDKVINVWGANHHGHIPRMKAAMEALGIDPNRLEVLLYQWVTLIRNGEKIGMSKRAGNFVLAKDVLAEIGSDALRFTFLTRDASTPLEFDVELVKKKARENPVYYAQYAHARMMSILGKSDAPVVETSKVELLTTQEELNILKHLNKFSELIAEIAVTYGVHQLTNYALTLADLFHKFYETSPVLAARNADITKDLSEARIALVKATQTVLKETLRLLGVSAPDHM
ncbi:MAG: arginine--tRNA ligase [candidate division WWE3 bacterium]|nr:arginine--tRNA ligase [candidate division WWE3 bacterium]